MINFLRKHLTSTYKPLLPYQKELIYDNRSFYIETFKTIRKILLSINSKEYSHLLVYNHEIGLCSIIQFAINRDKPTVDRWLVKSIIMSYTPLSVYTVLISDLYFYPTINNLSTILSPEISKRVDLVDKIISDLINKNL